MGCRGAPSNCGACRVYRYQKYSVSTQISLSVLNSTQQLILQSCMTGCLMVAAWAAVQTALGDGTVDVGNFVTVNVYIIQLFQPLNFLGTIYGTVRVPRGQRVF